MSNDPRQSKNQRRDAAREKARQQRARQQRRERRNRLVLQLSIGGVLIAIVAVVAVILVNSVRPPGPGPRNMANGGITLSGAELTAVETGAAAADATPKPEPTTSGTVRIQLFEDLGCPVCQAFEQTNGAQIEQLVKSGAAQVQYFPVAILDRNFTDRYSTRAANAAAAVASYSPNTFQAFLTRMYATDVQPKEGGAGLSDARLVQIAKQTGAGSTAKIQRAIEDGQFESWVEKRTQEFTDKTGVLADVDIPKASRGATPTVIVNGQFYTGLPNDADAFGSFVTSVGGAAAAPTSSPTPSPSSTD